MKLVIVFRVLVGLVPVFCLGQACPLPVYVDITCGGPHNCRQTVQISVCGGPAYNDYMCGSASGGPSCCGQQMTNDVSTNKSCSIGTAPQASRSEKVASCDVEVAAAPVDKGKAPTKATTAATSPHDPSHNESSGNGKSR